MTRMTDDELFEIGRRAYGMRPADYKGKLEGLAAERRALYEAGRQAAARDIRATDWAGREMFARIAEGSQEVAPPV